MFSKKITDSDEFISMSASAQALYFHLNQCADDDGFNNQIQIAMMKAHASNDDLLVLLSKNFIIRFESGVIVIKHWRMHNTLRKDRYIPTNYQEELKCLGLKDNGSYTLDLEEKSGWLPDGCQMVAVDKIRLDKNRLDKNNIKESEIPKKSDFDIALEDFAKMRKSIKKPLTENAKKRLLNKLEKLAAGNEELKIAILNQSVDHCWQDIYELKDKSVVVRNQEVKEQSLPFEPEQEEMSDEEWLRMMEDSE